MWNNTTRAVFRVMIGLALGMNVIGSANAVVLDFNSFSTITALGSISEDGFTVAPASGNLAAIPDGPDCGSGGCADNGTTTITAGIPGTVSPFTTLPVSVTRDGGGVFHLLGIDLAEAFVDVPFDANNADTIFLTGNLFGGGTVTESFALDGINDGDGGVADFQSALLASFWNTSFLTSLDISALDGSNQGAFSFDNISVLAVDTPATEVAEPGMLALFGIGLLGLGYARRKRTA